MSNGFDKRLADLNAQCRGLFRGARRGIEKESLRVDTAGRLARTPHPRALGSALSNEFITTDYSEALLEFVTPAYASIAEATRVLGDLHKFVHESIGDELLWASSMPCLLPDDDQIPLARYGDSNVGKMKTIYRRGLGYRYGRRMQTISGVHFNFSLPKNFWPVYAEMLGADDEDFRSAQYLSLIRNFRRYGWLLLFLFGASPALCRSFAGGGKLNMPLMNDGTYYAPYGTSLRMSDLGYSNKNQQRIRISLNNLRDYIRDITTAMHTHEPEYEAIGVRVDGRYRQLNANLLQIENEYYSSIRPKRVARSGERPTAALRRGGVQYVEVRALDCDIFSPQGIDPDTMRFVEAFLVFCLVEDSAPFDDEQLKESQQNQGIVAREGRDPDCELQEDGEPVRLQTWARRIADRIEAVAALMDSDEESYSAAVQAIRKRIDEPDLTPSARVLDELSTSGKSFYDLALELSRQHKRHYATQDPLHDDIRTILQSEASDSLKRQVAVEQSDQLSFEEYLARWFKSD